MNDLNPQDLLLKLLEQNNKIIEQNNMLIQINAEQSAQLSEVLTMFDDNDEPSRSTSLDG
ncbi:hypothetical protein PY247_11225 [Acinetobacter proteolyticus]|nr:hypothetical protein [Acinetobacter proteolyticus]WEI17132.1 hypothetical protein PY247_11225 [Acinetobacter proteolyticus]